MKYHNSTEFFQKDYAFCNILQTKGLLTADASLITVSSSRPFHSSHSHTCLWWPHYSHNEWKLLPM